MSKVIAAAERRLAGEEPAAEALLKSDPSYSMQKGWMGLGAMEGSERGELLDLMGVSYQLVFPTLAMSQFARTRDLDLLYGGSTALNRGMVDFCSSDERLLPIGYLPLTDPQRARQLAAEALTLGSRALWVPSDAPAGISPAHTDFDPVWSLLQEAHVPIVLHVGGGALLPKEYHRNGKPLPRDWSGGGETLRMKDFPVLHQSPERFLSCMVLDGVFERFPELHCGVIELGAAWVPALLQHVDAAATYFGKFEPIIKELSLVPSDYLRRQVRFTPLVFEDVQWLIDSAGPELFLFSTDYPHPEGGSDPFGSFERSLGTVGLEQRERFYAENFLHLMQLGDAATLR
jgi:predicted TIM-barrel fold metal-dependent hydrolase